MEQQQEEVVVDIQKQKYPQLDYNLQLHHQHNKNIHSLQQNTINILEQNQNLFIVKQQLNKQQLQQQFVNQLPLEDDNKDSQLKFSLQHFKFLQDQKDIKETEDLIKECSETRNKELRNCGFLAMVLQEYLKQNGCNFIFKKNSFDLKVENASIFLLSIGINQNINQAYYASFVNSKLDFSKITQNELNDFCNEFVNSVSQALQIPQENVDIFRVLKDKTRQGFIIQFDYKKPQDMVIQNEMEKLNEGLKKFNHTCTVVRKNIIKDFIFTTNQYLHQHTLSYKKENFPNDFEERGIINGIKQKYLLPFGFTSFGINSKSFSEDEKWLRIDTSDEAWPVGYIPGKINGQKEIPEFDFTKDIDTLNNKPILLGQLIYRNPDELEKHCHPFIVNGNKYIIAFQCRFDKKFLRIPSTRPNDYYVNTMQRATRPYKILLKKI